MRKIVLANSESYNAANLSQALTSYVAGLPIDEKAQSLLDFIAPPVRTANRFEYNTIGNGTQLVDNDDARAVRSEFKKVTVDGTVRNAKLVNRGLTLVIDSDEYFGDYEQEAAKFLKQRLILNELARAISMLKKATADAQTAVVWKSGGGTNPDIDIRTLVTSVGNAGGLNANRIVIGDTAWSYRLASLFGSEASAANAQALLNLDGLAGLVGADKIMNSDQRFLTKVKDSEGKAKKEFELMLSNYVFAFNSKDGASKYDPSTFKRFVGEDNFKVYVDKKAKTTEVTVEHYSLLAQTGTGACASLLVSNS